MTPSIFFTITFLFTLTRAAKRHVHVGELDGTLTFDPWFIHAYTADVVSFIFDTPNSSWSVVQSSFAAPCTPLAHGASSGAVYVPAGTPEASLPAFSYAVSSADPVWFFCGPQDVCQKGVVFAINPPGDEAYYLFRSQAANTSAGLSSAESTVSVPFSTPGVSSIAEATTPSVSVTVDSSSDGKVLNGGGAGASVRLSVLFVLNVAALYHAL